MQAGNCNYLAPHDQSIEGVLVHASCCAPKQSGSPCLTSSLLHLTALRTTLHYVLSVHSPFAPLHLPCQPPAVQGLTCGIPTTRSEEAKHTMFL